MNFEKSSFLHLNFVILKKSSGMKNEIFKVQGPKNEFHVKFRDENNSLLFYL